MDRRNTPQQPRTPGSASRPEAGAHQAQRGSQPQSGQRDASTHRSTPNTPNRGR